MLLLHLRRLENAIINLNRLKYLLPDRSSQELVRCPTSTLNISDEKKADVLIAVYQTLNNHIATWHEHSYQATTWSVLGLLGILSYVVFGNLTIEGTGSTLIITGTVMFGLLTQLYLIVICRSYHRIGCEIERCQAVLRLCEQGAYEESKTYFRYSSRWVCPSDIYVLLALHASEDVLKVESGIELG